jgi:hypothetical protein
VTIRIDKIRTLDRPYSSVSGTGGAGVWPLMVPDVGSAQVGRNLFLPRPSPYAARIVKSAPEQGIMPGGN